MLPIEIEVKFYLPDMEAFLQRLKSSSAVLKTKASETNIRIENREKTLYQQKCLLRVRRADKVTLTYKSAAPTLQNDFKMHHEIEVVVNDFEAMCRILKSLGFHKEQIYEKKRETWVMEQTMLCLDTMPYGNFVEIEGEPEQIRNISKRFGLNWENRILFNYLEIFETLKQKLNLSFSDITFDNFTNVSVDFNKFLHLFKAG